MHFEPVYPTPARPDLPAITNAEASALARATVNLLARWRLTDGQARIVLGGIAPRRWARWKAGDICRIDRDLRARMATLTLHVMLRGEITDLLDLRASLDAQVA